MQLIEIETNHFINADCISEVVYKPESRLEPVETRNPYGDLERIERVEPRVITVLMSDGRRIEKAEQQADDLLEKLTGQETHENTTKRAHTEKPDAQAETVRCHWRRIGGSWGRLGGCTRL
jgi:hypothetical protein